MREEEEVLNERECTHPIQILMLAMRTSEKKLASAIPRKVKGRKKK